MSKFDTFVNHICEEIVEQSLTHDEVRCLFQFAEERLTYGGFRPWGGAKEAPTAQSSEPLET